MTTIFGAFENAAFKEFERVFGEHFEFRPFAAAPGGGRRSADATRSVRSVIGIHAVKAFTSKEVGTEARGSTPSNFHRISLSFDIRQFPPNELPRPMDRFRREETGELFEVATDGERDSENRLKWGVKTLGFELP